MEKPSSSSSPTSSEQKFSEDDTRRPDEPSADSSATSSIPTVPTRQAVAGKLFKKCKSATFQIDGATYTIVASPPDRRVTKDDSSLTHTSPGRNGQLSKQGSLTIVRRSSTKKNQNHSDSVAGCPSSSSFADDEVLDAVDLATENLPAVDTPDACDKAALRLRCLLRQLQRGEISAELLQKNLQYAARVLEAVFIDETKERGEEAGVSSDTEQKVSGSSSSTSPLHRPSGPSVAPVQRRRLRTPVWARSLF